MDHVHLQTLNMQNVNPQKKISDCTVFCPVKVEENFLHEIFPVLPNLTHTKITNVFRFLKCASTVKFRCIDIFRTEVLKLPNKEVDDSVSMLFLEHPVWISNLSLCPLSLWFSSPIAGRTLHTEA